MYWIEFFISAVFIVLAGIRLTKYADRLSDALRLGKLWIGIVLLGIVTSLPEAITCLVAIVQIQANDLAAGNLLGSNNFNLVLIVLMDALFRNSSITGKISAQRSHSVSGLLSVVLMAIVAGEILFNAAFSSVRIGHMTVTMIAVAAIYFWGMYLLGQLEKTGHVPVDEPGEAHSLPEIWVNLLISSAVVVVSAMWLTKSADIIALQTGLGRSFVGTALLALVTSLPEMVVTISAVRMGAFDLCVGNIFGSNMTNMFIVSMCALIYREGIFTTTVNPAHALTPLIGILMSFVVLEGIRRGKKKLYGGFGLDSFLLVGLFIGGNALFYFFK